MMYEHVTVTSIMQTFRCSLSEPATLIMLSQEQPPNIGGNAASIEIPAELFTKNTSKTELFLADCMQWASSPTCFLFSGYNTLADALLFLKQFS